MQLILFMPQVKFFLRPNKKQINHTLYCRITIDDDKAEFSTKEILDPIYWNQKTQVYKSKDKKLNEYIENLTATLSYRIKEKSLFLEEKVSAKELLLHLQKKNVERVSLVQLIKEYISTCQASPGTIKNHTCKLDNLVKYQNFTKHKFYNDTFTLTEADRFLDWFKSSKGTKNSTAATRNILFFKYVLDHFLRKEEIKSHNLAAFKGVKDPIRSPVFLTAEEVEKLFNHQFEGVMLNKCKDLYLFQIATGLSYGDLRTKFNIQQTQSGKALVGSRQKNGQQFFVPLEPIAEEILNKYNGKLPVYDNIVYNRILKEIAAILGIEKKLTTHTGRKTFATLQDARGWSRESISMMLGHKSVKTTENYYIGQSFARIENEWKQKSR